jgi:hypothetical protein
MASAPAVGHYTLEAPVSIQGISRRAFLGQAVRGAALTAGLSAFPVRVGAGEPTAGRPNIVLILADDMGYGDCRAYNPKSKINTPHIDQLAKEGHKTLRSIKLVD